ncbi:MULTISPECIES: hypothetical protein [Clostridia]|uniref:hypothetical protein n=1 Tax=Clostridia TaxID=186801 RepID=UPI000E4FCF10|nr:MULTISPECIES: hypothetical protein [Clostridia]RHV71019.1 hypothetical protein DXB15_03675 [Roseburia sp. OM02-15]
MEENREELKCYVIQTLGLGHTIAELHTDKINAAIFYVGNKKDIRLFQKEQKKVKAFHTEFSNYMCRLHHIKAIAEPLSESKDTLLFVQDYMRKAKAFGVDLPESDLDNYFFSIMDQERAVKTYSYTQESYEKRLHTAVCLVNSGQFLESVHGDKAWIKNKS